MKCNKDSGEGAVSLIMGTYISNPSTVEDEAGGPLRVSCQSGLQMGDSISKN